MATLDMYGIGTALAAQFSTVTAPGGTAMMGGTVIRGSVVETPNNIPATPYVVIEMPSGEITWDNAGITNIAHDFDVMFLFQKASGDIPRDKKAMLQWLGPLINALTTHAQLGLGPPVMKSEVTPTYTYGTYRYGGDEYHAWHLIARVWTRHAAPVNP